MIRSTRSFVFALLALSLSLACRAPAAKPKSAPVLSPDERATQLVQQLTQAEKLQLVFGYFGADDPSKNYRKPAGAIGSSAGFVGGIARLGIPPLRETDAGIGVAGNRSEAPLGRTALPSGIATVATWSKALAYAGGAMIGDEARRSGFDVQLAGGVNLLREPRNGRNFEYGGEDPWLAGVMVGEEIHGIQSNRIISTVKHFALNDQERDRFTVDAKLGEAAARESDLLAFQIAIERGHPGAVMCAYNRVNGVYACESDSLLQQILKTDWRYPGFVMSDWGATHSTVAAANAGLDQESGWPFDSSAFFSSALAQAVEKKWVPQARLDEMVHRILRSMLAAGIFEDPPREQPSTIDFAAHAAVAQADEEEAIVLLRNEGNLLPLGKSLKTIAVIGGHADLGVLSGGGSSQVQPVGGSPVANEGPQGWPGPIVFDPSSPLQALAARTNARLTFVDGKDRAAAAKLAAQSEVAIVFATQWMAESIDAPDLNLPNQQNELIAAVASANPRTIVVLETGGPVLMPWLKEVGAVLEAWYPGARGGEAIARILSGEVNPSGHLPATFPLAENQLPRPRASDSSSEDHPRVDYDLEGAAVGYKWFDQKKWAPLFPFGFGLSYTQFLYSELTAAPDGASLSARFHVKNSGPREGKMVAQLYLSPPDGSWGVVKRLGNFEKISLQPGESKELSLTVDPRLLASFDVASKRWKIAGGDYKVMLGNSAGEISATTSVRLEEQSLDVRGQ